MFISRPTPRRRVGSSLFLLLCSLSSLLAAPVAGQSPLNDKAALPCIPYQEADKVVGRQSLVFGEIRKVGHAKKIHFLDFEANNREAFTIVIFENSLTNFWGELEDMYDGKKVVVRGVVNLYKGNPQIVIGHPDQIEVVQSFPARRLLEAKEVAVGDEMRLATYNIRNLFDGENDPYHNDETTKAKPRDELERVANVIREINADVIALQEVESRGYLEAYLDLMLADMGYRHVVHFEGNDSRGIDVCVVSRIPIGAVTSNRHRTFPSAHGAPQSFNRDLLQVELLPQGGTPFELWVVHLKSNHGGREEAEPIRLAESAAVRQLVEERLARQPNASFAICGDFNDTFESPTVQTIAGNANAGNTGETSPQLQTFFQNVPESDRITFNREPHRSMIDFFLCSPAMAARHVGGTYRIRNSTLDESGSDHNPVLASFYKLSPSEATDVKPTESDSTGSSGAAAMPTTAIPTTAIPTASDRNDADQTAPVAHNEDSGAGSQAGTSAVGPVGQPSILLIVLSVMSVLALLVVAGMFFRFFRTA